MLLELGKLGELGGEPLVPPVNAPSESSVDAQKRLKIGPPPPLPPKASQPSAFEHTSKERVRDILPTPIADTARGFANANDMVDLLRKGDINFRELPALLEKARGAAKYMNADGTLNLKTILPGVDLKDLPSLIAQGKASAKYMNADGTLNLKTILPGVDLAELPALIAQGKAAAKYMNADGTPNFGELLSGGLKSVGGLMKEHPLASAAVVGGLGLGAYSLFGNKGNNNNNNNQQTPIQPQVPANQWMANLTKSQGRVDAISPTA